MPWLCYKGFSLLTNCWNILLWWFNIFQNFFLCNMIFLFSTHWSSVQKALCVGSVSKSLFEIISRQKFAINGTEAPRQLRCFYFILVFFLLFFGICKCCNAICLGCCCLAIFVCGFLSCGLIFFRLLINRAGLSCDFMMRPSASHHAAAEAEAVAEAKTDAVVAIRGQKPFADCR